MTIRQTLLSMTASAALLALPAYAFAQQGGSAGGGSSMQTTTTQTTPQQGPLSGAPAARGPDASGGVMAQGTAPGATPGATPGMAPGMAPGATPGTTSSPRDGTPGNPPSTATGRAVDRAQGQTPQPDGTPGNPPGTAAGRAMDRTLGTNTTGANPAGTSAVTGTTGAATGAAATGAAMVPMDSAALRDGRRASKVIGSNIYNENNESIGEVDDIIIPPGRGGAPVAVISVGGFLGIGAKLVAVPYERLQMNTERNRWVLSGATKDSLTGLPTFSYDAAAGERRG